MDVLFWDRFILAYTARDCDMSYVEYGKIKALISEYWLMKDVKKYDEFIRQLVDIMQL